MQTAEQKFRKLLKDHQEYREEAYSFIYEALDHAKEMYKKRLEKRGGHHVTARELLESFRLHAIDQFGCLASIVLKAWGVKTTSDIGDIVFNLVEYDLMGKQEKDTRKAFDNVYEFSAVFSLKPVFSYEKEREWKCRYIQKQEE